MKIVLKWLPSCPKKWRKHVLKIILQKCNFTGTDHPQSLRWNQAQPYQISQDCTCASHPWNRVVPLACMPIQAQPVRSDQSPYRQILRVWPLDGKRPGLLYKGTIQVQGWKLPALASGNWLCGRPGVCRGGCQSAKNAIMTRPNWIF